MTPGQTTHSAVREAEGETATFSLSLNNFPGAARGAK